MVEVTKDLRSFIEGIEKIGLLKTVKGADWDLEIGAVTDTNSKSNKYTLLFDEVKGYPKGFRVLTGALLDSRRVSTALGLDNSMNNMQLTTAIRDRLRNAASDHEKYKPKVVPSAPVLENTDKGDKIDFFKFPIPKWFKYDGGRYIGTADAVITRDPDIGWVNVGTYRVMVKSKNSLVMLMEASRHG
ncbi:MAG: UbiD family decarboxylase, partial [Candidatus Thermoplasmatota archaeon]|nr:UbiD family decarboxylase [Candidatus Thermoplasmatota archaeon]